MVKTVILSPKTHKRHLTNKRKSLRQRLHTTNNLYVPQQQFNDYDDHDQQPQQQFNDYDDHDQQQPEQQFNDYDDQEQLFDGCDEQQQQNSYDEQPFEDDNSQDDLPIHFDMHDQTIKFVQDNNTNIDSLNETQFLLQFMNHNCRDKSTKVGKEGRKIATCLAWTYYNKLQSHINHNQLEEWSFVLITTHTDLINEYIHNHLCKYLLYKFTTVKLWVSQVLEPFIQWFTEKRPNCGIKYVVTGSMIYKLDKFIGNLIKMCNRNKRRGARSRKTKKDYIEKRILPTGNVNQTLIDLCQKQYNIYKCIDIAYINKVIYTHFLQVLVTAFWTGPQGRCKAIELLTYQEGLQLLDKNKYIEKYDFKNCDRLITQPVLSYGILR